MQIDTKVTDHLVATMTKKELQQFEDTWKQVHLSTVISKRNTVKGLNIPEYNLKGVKSKICIVREVVILPFVTTVVKGIVNLTTHSKCMNIAVKSVTGYWDCTATARSYGVLRAERGKIDVWLRNHSAKQITLPKWTALGEITAGNIIPFLSVWWRHIARCKHLTLDHWS